MVITIIDYEGLTFALLNFNRTDESELDDIGILNTLLNVFYPKITQQEFRDKLSGV